MIALWYMEAGKYNVFPLDSRGTARFADERPELTKDRKTYVYYPQTQMVPENVAAKLLNRSHSLTVDAEIPKEGAEGVLVGHGGHVGGYTLFVKDEKLHYGDAQKLLLHFVKPRRDAVVPIWMELIWVMLRVAISASVTLMPFG